MMGKFDNTIRNAGAGLLGFALLLMGNSAGAMDVVIGTPDNSFVLIETNAGGGGNIPGSYNRVRDYVGPSQSFTDDYSHPYYGWVSVGASSDLGTRQIAVETAQNTTGINPFGTTQSNSSYAVATVRDRISINEPFAAPLPVMLTAYITHTVGDPTLVTNVTDIFGRLSALWHPVSIDDTFFYSYSSFANPGGTPDPIPTQLSVQFDLNPAQPWFDIELHLQAGISTFGSVLSAELASGFEVKLPDGYSYSSESGFHPTPVPVPAALPLFVSALAGLGLGAWRKRRAALN